MKASKLSSAIFLRWSTGERIFEMSMAYSVLQLSTRRGRAAHRDDVATTVPCGTQPRFSASMRGQEVRLCGLLRQVMQFATAVALACCAFTTSAARAQAPSEDAAIDAFLAARGWLDRDALPALDAPEAAVALGETDAIAVILRVNGRVVGRGDDATDDPSDQLRMLRRAVGRAIAEALGDSIVRAVRPELNDQVTAGFSLEIELAGPTKPLLGRTIAEAATRIIPGTDGIAVLRGDEAFRAFPSRLLASDNADRPDATITMLMRSAGLPAKELRDFATSERVSLAKFDTVRIRQSAPNAPPSIVTRGGRLVAFNEVTPGFVRTLAIQLTARLCGNVVARPEHAADAREEAHEEAHEEVHKEEPEGALGGEAAKALTTETPAISPVKRDVSFALLGTYNPTADAFDPPFASASDEAFAALALAWASLADVLPTPTRTAAAAQAAKLVDDLARDSLSDGIDTKTDAKIHTGIHTGSDAGSDTSAEKRSGEEARQAEVRVQPNSSRNAAVDAMVLHATRLAQLASPPQLELRVRMTAQALAESAAPDFDAQTVEVIASTIAALTARGASEDDVRLGARLLDRLLAASSDRRGRLADAALPLAIALTQGTLPEQSRSALRPALEEIARVAENLQVGVAPTSDGTPMDLAGGLALPSARLLIADAQCLRLAAAVAILRAKPGVKAVGDENDPGASAPRPSSRTVLAFARFLAQHVANEPWTDGFRQPDALRGLVRASLATDDCPPAATAAGIFLALAAEEALRLDR